MIKKRKFYLLAVFFLLTLFSCSNHKLENKIDVYKKTLPKEESINASLYNYELIIKKGYSTLNNDPLLTIQHCLDYFKTFQEDDQTGSINLLLAKSIPLVIDTINFASNFNTLTYDEKVFLAVKKSKDGKFSYSNEHLHLILKERNDYEIEKEAAHMLFSINIRSNPTPIQIKNNLQLLDFISRRYPDEIRIYKFVTNSAYFPVAMLKSSEKSSYEAAANAILESFPTKERGTLHFITSPIASVRNKPSYPKSRPLANLGPWEYVEKIGTPMTNEQGKFWSKVRFQKERYGYIELSLISTNQINSLQSDHRKYFQAIDLYYSASYIQAADAAASLILSCKNKFLKEKTLLLLYKSHNQIAVRATSLQSPFFYYVEANPIYFYYFEEELSLAPSKYLATYTQTLYPDSDALKYFTE